MKLKIYRANETENEIDLNSFSSGLSYPSTEMTANALNTGADLSSSTKEINTSSVNVGDTVTFTFSIPNTGDESAVNTIFYDTLPKEFSFVSGSVYVNGVNKPSEVITLPPGVSVGTLPPGFEGTVTFMATAINATTLPVGNTGYLIYTDSITGEKTNPTTTVTIPNIGTPTIPANLASSLKTVNNQTPSIGDIITYTVNVINLVSDENDAFDATNVILKDILTEGLSFVAGSAKVDGVSVGGDPTTTGINVGTVEPTSIFDPNKIKVVTFDVKVEDIPIPNPFTNIANLSYFNGINQVSNNIFGQPINVVAPDFGGENFLKYADKKYADIGDIVEYTFQIKNGGDVTATDVIFKDVLNLNIKYVEDTFTVNNSLIPGADPNNGVNIGDIAPNELVTVKFKAQVLSLPINGLITNQANISYSFGLGSGSANSNFYTLIINSAKLSLNDVSKTSDKTTTTPGDIITFNIEITNPGNVDILNALIVDDLDPSLEFLDGSVIVNNIPLLNEDITTGVVIPIIPVNSSANIEFKAKVLENSQEIINNTANINYNYIVDPSNPPVNQNINVPSAPINNIIPANRLILNKVALRNPSILGDVIPFVITIKNNNTIPLNKVVVTDILGQGLTYNNNLIINNNPSAQDITTGINLGTLNPNQEVKITFDAKVTSIPQSGITTNTVNTTFEYIINSKIFSAQKETTIDLRLLDANIVASKTVSTDVVVVGNIFEYTIKLRNEGNIDSTNIVVKDEFPKAIEVLDVKVDGISVNGDIQMGISVGKLGIGEEKTIVITVKALDKLEDEGFLNVALISSTFRPDPNSYESIITESVTQSGNPVIIICPRLSINKKSDKKYVAVGDTIDYSAVIKNTGNVNLQNITISDLLPSNVEFIEGTVAIDGVSYPKSNITSGINIPNLKVNEQRIVTFKGKAIAKGEAKNKINATYEYLISPNKPPAIGTDMSNINIVNISLAQIKVIKSANKEDVVLGDVVDYSVNIINTGDLDAFNVIFKDDLPKGLELISGSFNVDGRVINNVNLNKGVNIGKIAKGQSVLVKYSAKVVGSNCSSTLVNSAMVEFLYSLPDGSVGMGQSEKTNESIRSINMGVTNFKQFSIEEYLKLPARKPDIEAINNINASLTIIKCHIIKTQETTSIEGQILSGYKAVIHGVVKLDVEYTACEALQSVHATHYDIPFTNFIILPMDYRPGSKIEIEGEIEDVYNKVLDCRTFFINVTTLINAKILSC